jgi:hypothetical protein
MAKYSIATYGISKYGEREVSRTYYASGIRSWSYNFNSISIAWGSITPSPEDSEPTHWRLVRGFSGVPDTPFDGIYLDGDVISAFRTTYIDNDVSTENREVNYSIWVFGANAITGVKRWIFCGDTDIIVTQQTDTLSKLINWLPRIWFNTVNGVGDAVGEAETNDLSKTLSAYTFMYDKLNAEAELISKASSNIIPSALLESQVLDLGFNYEPALGDSYHRSLYRAGNVINSVKGTKGAVSGYITGLTHLSSKIKLGHNLMLDYNDSSFEESTGRWHITRGTKATVKFATSAATLGTAITPPKAWVNDSLYPPKESGFGVFTVSESTSTVSPSTLQLPIANANMPLLGIPVEGNKEYLYTGWFRQIDGNVFTLSVKINWWNYLGETISSTTLTSPITSSNSWQEFTSGSSAGRLGRVSPLDAAYASIELLITPSTLSETKVLLDKTQFSESKYSLAFEDAKQVNVYVQGSKENLIPNPSFEDGTGSWLPSANSNFISRSFISSNAIFFGSSVGALTALNSSQMYVSSDWIEVDPGQNYTFSAYVSTDSTIINKAIIKLEFSNRESIEQQTLILSDTDGEYYDSTIYSVQSAEITLTNALVSSQRVPTRTRISISAIAPAYTRDSGNPVVKVSFIFPICAVGESAYIDSCLLQPTALSLPFFDGSSAPVSSTPVTEPYFFPGDCLWEYKDVYNFIQEPSFETISTWVANVGTLTMDSTSGTTLVPVKNSNGTLGTPTNGTYTAKYGSKMGKLTYVAATGGNISTTVVLPSPAKGGEDFVVSAYVRAAEGSYTLTVGSSTFQSVTRVSDKDKYQWTRISAVKQLAVGETTFTVTIKIDPPSAGYVGTPTTFFHIDGVQAEYGKIPSAYINPSSTTSSVVPISGSSNTYLVDRVLNTNASRSSYFPNYEVKFSRLRNSLALVMPHGSSWSVKPGLESGGYPELVESLIPSASFENSLDKWVPENSSLVRKTSKGSLFGDQITHGTSWCEVTTSGTSNATKVFGLTSGTVPVVSGQGYYASIAIKPKNAASAGTYKLKATFYTPTGSILPVLIQDPAFPSDPTKVLDVTAQYMEKSVTVTRTDRWAYISNTYPSLATLNAASAKLTITFIPSTFDATQSFNIDRVVFRE